ncbi:MAG: thiamine pyrophosphate-dependent dehydrogenase E1 component subunit alpha [Chloroflexi bacterium]|nr:thiamine pyrophosphate-dependent dehydrogenase E1 component subunit alpha [Chloroflexota bacterium]
MADTVQTRPLAAPTEVGLGREELLGMYRTMLLARALGQRMWLLARTGKTHFAVSGDGHEAVQVAAAQALDRTQDWCIPFYRDLAMMLHLGITARDVMLDDMARAEAPFGRGRQLPAHWSARRLRIVSGSSPVTTQLLHAAGVALASKLRGETAVTLTTCGDGATSEGDFHEALNFASVHRLPVVFVVENNGWAISVPRHKQMAVASIAERAAGYAMPGVTVDGTDLLESYKVIKEAVDRARAGEGPTLIDAQVVRLVPHSTNDDERRYRPAEELADAKARDPLPRYRAHLVAQRLLTEADDTELKQEVAQVVDDATDFAERSSYPDPSEIATHLYAGR